MSVEALPFVMMLGVFFGTTLVASRFGVGQFEPAVYVGLRMALASAVHAAIYIFWRSHRFPRNGRVWKHAIVLGVLGTAVPMTSIVASLEYLSSGLASVLITTNPAVIVLMAHFLLSDEKLNRRKSFGILLALGGALLLALSGENGLGDAGPSPLLGYLLMGLAIFMGGAMTVYARKYMSDFDSFDVASIRMGSAAVVVLPLSLFFLGFDPATIDGQGYFVLFYAALVGTFVGMLLSFYNVKRFGATAAAMTAYVVPLVAVIGGWLLLDEKVTAVMLIGMGLIIFGIAIINRHTGRAKEKQSLPLPANPVPLPKKSETRMGADFTD